MKKITRFLRRNGQAVSTVIAAVGIIITIFWNEQISHQNSLEAQANFQLYLFESQTENRKWMLDELSKQTKNLEDRFLGLEGRFLGLEGRFVGLEDRFVGLEDRFVELEDRVTKKLDEVVKEIQSVKEQGIINTQAIAQNKESIDEIKYQLRRSPAN